MSDVSPGCDEALLPSWANLFTVAVSVVCVDRELRYAFQSRAVRRVHCRAEVMLMPSVSLRTEAGRSVDSARSAVFRQGWAGRPWRRSLRARVAAERWVPAA
ncbi:hypothetical protein B1C81_29835 [Streptomyces sp. HG99]|nr:hypothetical protein B1C81_29835 [Streptomyces sp. HG99]